MAAAPPVLTPLQKFEVGIAELEAVFLPAAIKMPPDVYSSVELTTAKAFVVFSHAQLEDYLEEACLEKANRTLHRVQFAGAIDVTALSLISHFGDKRLIPGETTKYKERNSSLAPDFPTYDSKVNRSLLSRLKDAVTGYAANCRANNGVNERSLMQLLVPLGLDPLRWDSLWVGEMQAFGSDRGSHAHRGLAGVRRISDPFQSKERIHRILEGPPGAAAVGNVQIYSLRTLDAFLSI